MDTHGCLLHVHTWGREGGGHSLDANAGPHGVEGHAGDGRGHEHEHVRQRALGARHGQPQEDARADQHAEAADEQEVLHLCAPQCPRLGLEKFRVWGTAVSQGASMRT